ncbi:sugar transporter SWEET1 [Caerostris extrusa]|uniref:Sugar transporter SWEET1 n=1 Tax=Caerostris extrusa TaxID=172846 RepID=A0AAV4NKI2_CAEEX|nr:sugar transporter SWEET1 [Caerostris extrusa]
MDLTLIVGNIATVCTIGSAFSGLPICLEFFRKKSTANVPVLPFLAGWICTSLWLQYSLMLGDTMMQVVNWTCSILQAIYVLCYNIATTDKKNTQQMTSVAVCFLVATYAFGFHIATKATVMNIFGLMAAVSSVLASAAPLATVKTILKTKNSVSLPLPIIFSTFIVTSLWFFYGILVENSFIQVPNLISAIISVLQLILIAVYPSKKAVKED